jgi:hypothetical protein
VSGRVTLLNEGRDLKASSPIAVTVIPLIFSGISIFSPIVAYISIF